MLMYEMTMHAKVERLDRLVECVTHIGLGDVILTARNYDRSSIRQLTSTGIILVTSADGKTLITGYMGNISQVVSMYRDNGINKVPDRIYKMVKRNCEKYKFLLEMK